MRLLGSGPACRFILLIQAKCYALTGSLELPWEAPSGRRYITGSDHLPGHRVPVFLGFLTPTVKQPPLAGELPKGSMRRRHARPSGLCEPRWRPSDGPRAPREVCTACAHKMLETGLPQPISCKSDASGTRGEGTMPMHAFITTKNHLGRDDR